jgi:hypothetical protein
LSQLPELATREITHLPCLIKTILNLHCEITTLNQSDREVGELGKISRMSPKKTRALSRVLDEIRDSTQ